jgi:hypothetical protein
MFPITSRVIYVLAAHTVDRLHYQSRWVGEAVTLG